MDIKLIYIDIFISLYIFNRFPLTFASVFICWFYIGTCLSGNRGNIRFFCSLDKSGSSSIPRNAKLDKLMTPPKKLTLGLKEIEDILLTKYLYNIQLFVVNILIYYSYSDIDIYRELLAAISIIERDEGGLHLEKVSWNRQRKGTPALPLQVYALQFNEWLGLRDYKRREEKVERVLRPR